MPRIYFLKKWHGLEDEALEESLCHSQALRSFAGVEPNRDAGCDATLLKSRRWLERHALTRVLFEEIGMVLEKRGLLMRQGTNCPKTADCDRAGGEDAGTAARMGRASAPHR